MANREETTFFLKFRLAESLLIRHRSCGSDACKRCIRETGIPSRVSRQGSGHRAAADAEDGGMRISRAAAAAAESLRPVR